MCVLPVCEQEKTFTVLIDVDDIFVGIGLELRNKRSSPGRGPGNVWNDFIEMLRMSHLWDLEL